MVLATQHPAKFNPRSSLMTGFAKKMGAMTYPLYLVHSVAGAGLMVILIHHSTPAKLALAITLIVALVLSYGISVYWEPFVRRRLKEASQSARTASLDLDSASKPG
jgi:peptidoglycan/LPS O-acetylase OafA/YrhL